VPLYDLLQRAKQGDPRIAYNYVGGQGDRAPWVIVPWITPAWVDEQRALLTHAPNRFRRMILNVPAGPDAGLIAADELQDAIDKTLSEPETGVPGTRYVMAVDLGIANDWSCICLTHVDEDSRVVVDLTRTWRPQNGERVNLGDVEIEIRRLAARFTLEKIILDQWQAEYIQQRLAASGLPAELVTFEASRQDRVITLLKSVFSKRQIRLGAHESWLIEQLESVTAVESRRRDLLRFAPSGKGIDAGAHDDLVVALALTLEHLQEHIGKVRLAEMRGCALEQQSGYSIPCVFWGGNDGGHQRLCRTQCPAWVSALAIHQRYVERGGDLDIRTWLRQGGVAPNAYILRRRMRQALERAGSTNTKETNDGCDSKVGD
jgi:hypothetical protein